MILVTHAYSRRNAGDSLLVDLTLEYIARAGIDRSECTLLALDAPSFEDLPSVHQVGVPGREPSLAMVPAIGKLVQAAVASWIGAQPGELPKLFARARGIVAVGGGYLRAGNAIESAGCLLNHVPQLALAARAAAPAIYLPQSIGPLQGPVGSIVRRALARAELVCVRDDTSARELPSAIRYPDLAVMRVAEQAGARANGGGPVILVARALDDDRSRGYEERLRALASRLGDVTWAVQAASVGRKDDRVFYRRMGIEGARPLSDVLASTDGGVVLSVRLHGALQAIIAGRPAIHLGYQRKSYGAYADLGLESFVHDGRAFDPEAVAAQARALRGDPSAFWDAVESRRPALLERSKQLVEEIASRIGAPNR